VIELHRLHGNGTFLVNPDLIEMVEACPDTTITLVNKHRYVVEDTVEAVVERIVAFRTRIAAAAGSSGDWAAGARIVPVIETDQEQAA
jgi:flagellar protein FlbD